MLDEKALQVKLKMENGKLVCSHNAKDMDINKVVKMEIHYDINRFLLNLPKLKNTARKLYFGFKSNKNKLLEQFTINNVTYYLYTDNKGDLYISKNINHYLKVKQKVIALTGFKNYYFLGIISNILHKDKKFDYIYIGDTAITKIIRPFKKSKLKHLGIIKIPFDTILKSNDIHNEIKIGNKEKPLINLRYYKYNPKKGMNYYRYRKYKNKLLIIRSTIRSERVVITNIDFYPEYKIFNKIKNKLAKFLSKITPKSKINLFFEKETRQAKESGYYVFEKVVEYCKKNNRKVKNYFIIDKNYFDYYTIKEKYKNLIVKKYSFKHYYLIYKSNYFISSELSNHVINTRLYLTDLNTVIKNKPLIFLQHGIMFAKPVDNPAAKAFYKDNSAINVYKSIISSELEATQFYKMGYSRSDLIKCGLPKFDISTLNKKAKKIMFMPTYRFWEEKQINDPNKITETTYWKLLNIVIHAFEKNGLINSLIISAHPKFAEKIAENMPEYSHVIEPDVNKGLENARIFITDYSSASFDAHHRGANIIYYWEERDYLIENYQAIPPINENNCDGVPVFSIEELINEIKKIKKRKYQKLPLYEQRYKQINEFSDNRNTERLLEELNKLNII